ncbi:MAG: hypothetical protein JXA52_00205, partial [Planctomycetes bacterium]|nr:hypothetical protein [Planctomycetota bacterium]
AIIREDAVKPLPAGGTIIQGDARELPLADASIGGILTSPPYLSRYDYTRINRPLEDLYNSLHPGLRSEKKPVRQVRAHARAHQLRWQSPPHPAVQEACSLLQDNGKRKEAGIMQSYFDDMRRVVQECARVLKDGAPLTLVIAGAIFYDIYIPADLVVAEFCEEARLEVEEILLVRSFSRAKRLGNIDQVAPREVIMSARK